RVQAGLVAPRALGPERGDRAVDEARVGALDRVVVDAEALRHPAAEPFDDDVGPGGEAPEGVAALGTLPVEAERALVTVDREVQHAFAVANRARVYGAAGVRRLPRFHLHDVGAHVGQVHAADGAGDQVGELEDPHAVQRWAQGVGHDRFT